MKKPHIIPKGYGRYRYTAIYQYRGIEYVAYGMTPIKAYIRLITKRHMYNDESCRRYHEALKELGVVRLRRVLLSAKGRYWNTESWGRVLRTYQKYCSGSTSGTSLGLGE